MTHINMFQVCLNSFKLHLELLSKGYHYCLVTQCFYVGLYVLMNNFSPQLLESLVHFVKILPSWCPDCPDCSSFCPLSSSGQDCGTLHLCSAHACSQVSVYQHLSVGPEGSNPLLCSSASVLDSRSARYWDQPDTTAVTWSECQCRPCNAVKFLHTATFHWGLKITTLCFRQMHLLWLGPSSHVTNSALSSQRVTGTGLASSSGVVSWILHSKKSEGHDSFQI